MTETMSTNTHKYINAANQQFTPFEINLPETEFRYLIYSGKYQGVKYNDDNSCGELHYK